MQKWQTMEINQSKRKFGHGKLSQALFPFELLERDMSTYLHIINGLWFGKSASFFLLKFQSVTLQMLRLEYLNLIHIRIRIRIGSPTPKAEWYINPRASFDKYQKFNSYQWNWFANTIWCVLVVLFIQWLLRENDASSQQLNGIDLEINIFFIATNINLCVHLDSNDSALRGKTDLKKNATMKTKSMLIFS